MKTIFTLITSLLISASLLAADARPKSTLTVMSAGNEDIRVVVDGKRFEPNTNSVSIRNLEAGYHTIKVYRQKSNGFFTIIGKRYELAYNATLSIKERTHVQVSIDRNGRASVQQTNIRNERDNGWYGGGRDYSYDRDGQWGDYDNNYGYAGGMDAREFNRLLQSIDREWRETNKMKSATQVAQNNSLTTSQVMQLMQLFAIEGNKLEIAKVAYRNTVDKRNYQQVYSLLSFSSSKAELDRFIRTSR